MGRVPNILEQVRVGVHQGLALNPHLHPRVIVEVINYIRYIRYLGGEVFYMPFTDDVVETVLRRSKR